MTFLTLCIAAAIIVLLLYARDRRVQKQGAYLIRLADRHARWAREYGVEKANKMMAEQDAIFAPLRKGLP